MANVKSFFERMNAVVVMIMACVVTLVGCDKADVGDEAMRKTTSYDASYVETSTLTPDNNQGTAHLSVYLEKFYGQTSEGKKNADVVSKCVANVETDPVETANMEKTFVSGEIVKNAIENSSAKQFTCDIKVNGDENLIKTKVTVTPDMAWDRNYDCKVTKVEVAKDEVKIVETSKKSGEKGRQAISAPVDFTIEAIGTEEARSCVVRQTVAWEQYQLESTPTIVDGDIDSWTLKIGNWNFDTNIHWKNIWSDGTETFEDFTYQAHYSGEAAALEDLFVKNWMKTLKNIEGLTTGTESKVKEEAPFTEYMREDIYAANHNTSSETTTKCVYFWRHPKVVFEKNGKKHVFDFVSPNFSENGNDLLDATSMKSGYDLKVFRNSVTVKYGNAETGVDEQVMEARQNLYKQARAVKGIEVVSKTKDYPAFAIDYIVKYRLIYNDDTKSEDIYTATTSRPWSLGYDGAWTMTATGEVSQSTTAIVLTKGESKTEKQEIANGYWNCTSTNYTAIDKTTVDGKVQTNSWKLKVPTKMVLNLYNTEVPFDEDAPKAEAKNAQISLTNNTATQETYTFTEMLHATVGTDTETSEATGTVTKAVEVKVDSWEWKSDYSFTNDKLNAWVEKIYHMTDGSTKTVRREFTGTRGSNVYTYFETTEVNNSETTGSAQFNFNTQAVTDGDWSFNKLTGTLNFGVTYAGSEQKDGWNLIEYNNLSCTIDGDTFTFPAFEYNAQANASQTKKSETDSQTTYEHKNAPTYTFGGYSMTLGTANGLVFVNKTVEEKHHDGFFPKEYGKMEGYNRVACRNPHNQKDWGVGISVKFTNGSICGFITKDGNLEWGSFESGSTTWDGASPDGNGTLMNVTAKDASTAMKWRRGDSTINMMSYSDGTLMGFNWGHNTVYTDKFGGNIEQKDGGKYQVLTINGVNGSWDSSF